MFDQDAYRRANDAIHAPAELKRRAAAGQTSALPRSRARRALPRAGGLAAAVVVIALLLQLPFGGGMGTAFASAAYVADYPQALTRDDFDEVDGWTAYRDSITPDPAYLEGLSGFTLGSAQAALTQLDGANGVYSPLALYMALAMAAELSAGETQGQILDLLGTPDPAALREQTGRIWNSARRDSEASQTLLANSLWLSDDEKYAFREEPLTVLRDEYYASTYVADMGSADTQNAIHRWLDEQTGGLLREQAEGVEVDPGTVALLLSTVYFHDQWISPFHEESTAPDTFTLADGSTVTCDFMHKTTTGSYVGAEGFTAASLPFEGDCSMTFILPDEGWTADDLLSDDGLMERILAGAGDDPDSGFGEIRFSVPKFSVSADLDLIPILRQLGVTHLFDWTTADLTPLSDYPLLYFARATQSTTLSIDEVGCTAASFVEMEARASASLPDGLCVLDLDRPFLFLISGADGVPLFLGVVNDPTV